MNNKYRVAFATCARSDYGIVRNYLSLLNNDNKIILDILVTGSLTKKKYNKEINMIIHDGFNIGHVFDTPLKSTTSENIIHDMSMIMDDFCKHFKKHKYDLLIILGDRYEMLPIAISASMLKMPILHIHGGEATYGNYDEFIRHSITKMSLFHFTSTEKYRKRVIQLGESPKRVFNLGSLGVENCLRIDMDNVSKEIVSLSENEYFVVLFHPETITNEKPDNQIKILMKAISNFDNYKYVFIGTNSDTGSDLIRSIINKKVKNRNNYFYFENLHPDAYHYLLKHSLGLIGNSSSGIIEAPSLGIFTINIGNRQLGRESGKTVINTKCDEKNIVKAIRYILNNKAEKDNKYYKRNASKNYYLKTLSILKKIKNNNSIIKEFYDLNK